MWHTTPEVPFILVELTGEGDAEGEIEVCGKDEYGVLICTKRKGSA